MPLRPTTGSDGTALSLAHVSSRDDGFMSPGPGLEQSSSQWGVTADSLPTLAGRSTLGSVNATIAMASHQRCVIQMVATSTAVISLASTLLAVYWFCMMRRNFRRDLVLLLILGGSWKSLWFLTFSAATFINGSIPSRSAFCQASGYLLLVGFESCDLAILFMSMHMCLQIFPRARGIFGHDGLYPLRKWVIAIWFLLPHIIASLAFINPRGGYIAQGAFCFLPVRPFWYRLALFWVPRYLIWVYITYVAIRIYRHVGAEFKVFGQERDRSSSLGMPGESSIDRAKQRNEVKRMASQVNASTKKQTSQDDMKDCAPDDMSCQNRLPQDSTNSPRRSILEKGGPPEWSTIGFAGESSISTPSTTSVPTSRRGSKILAPGILSEDFASLSALDSSPPRGSVTSLGSKRSAGRASFVEDLGLPSITEGLPSQSAAACSERSENTAKKTMELRRRAIQRQLRLLFIYPCVYMILWIIPFAVHCMNYTTYYAHHPIFALNVVQILCMGVMTFVDVLIFCWREKPWKHIPGSDGTFVGSLCWWRFALDGVLVRGRRDSRAPSSSGDATDERDEEKAEEKSVSQTGLLSTLKQWSLSFKGQSPRGSESSGTVAPSPSAATTRPSIPHKRTYSGGSDRKFLEAERAHERLAMERAEYEANRRSLQERRASVASGQLGQQRLAERKDWFDRTMEGDLFEDGTGGDGEGTGTV